MASKSIPIASKTKKYAAEVRAILEGDVKDEMIYMTLAQRLEEVSDGLHKISHRKYNQGPEFPGPVWILLGLKEEEVINAMAYYEGLSHHQEATRAPCGAEYGCSETQGGREQRRFH